MKTIEIFDPAMCCPTGLCGTNIDPNLMRIAVIIDNLKKRGVDIKHHNLKDEPQIYITNTKVNDLLQSKGVEALPITLVDGEVAVIGSYPTTKQMSEWSGINLDFIPMPKDDNGSCSNVGNKEDCC